MKLSELIEEFVDLKIKGEPDFDAGDYYKRIEELKTLIDKKIDENQ